MMLVVGIFSIALLIGFEWNLAGIITFWRTGDFGLVALHVFLATVTGASILAWWDIVKNFR